MKRAEQQPDSNTEYQVILFYKFIQLDDPEGLKEAQKELCDKIGLKGRLLISGEGINGTFEGSVDQISDYVQTMNADPRFDDIVYKYSASNGQAFTKLKIKVRDEIVTLNPSREIYPTTETAPELSADELQKWYEENEDFVVLDLRNDYEIKSGYFEKTVDPGLRTFRDLTDEKINELANNPAVKGKKVVTVCTGGIRCEKATCLMNDGRFPELYQLKDGIHTYMEKYPNQHFKGTLFVFDNRSTTDIGADPDREVVSQCFYCEEKTENYVNDDSQKPSVKILCCPDCFAERSDRLRGYVSR